MANPVRYNAACPLQANGEGRLVRYEDYAALEAKYKQLLQRAGPESLSSLRPRVLAYIKMNALGATRSQVTADLGGDPNEIYLCINSLAAKGDIVFDDQGIFKAVK